MTSATYQPGTIAIPAKSGQKLGSRKLALSCLALLLGLAAAWYGREWWTVGRFIESTDDAYVGGNVTSIAPHVAGFVTEILVTDNQYVHAGQLLMRLDARDFQAALDRVGAVVLQRQATLDTLRAKYQLQQAAIRQAIADVAAKSARAVFAREDAARYRSLAQGNAGSRQDAERTQALDQEAQSALLSSQAGLEAARQQLVVLDAGIKEAEAEVTEAAAELSTARLNLSYTEIRSPIEGYIGNRAAQVGAYVAEGAYLLTIIPARGLWVDANFKEDQLESMVPGQTATIVADVAPGHVFHGRVLSVAPGTGATFSVIPPENATGNFTKIVQRVPVRIALDDDDAVLGMLRLGLSTTVAVDTRTASGSMQ